MLSILTSIYNCCAVELKKLETWEMCFPTTDCLHHNKHSRIISKNVPVFLSRTVNDSECGLLIWLATRHQSTAVWFPAKPKLRILNIQAQCGTFALDSENC